MSDSLGELKRRIDRIEDLASPPLSLDRVLTIASDADAGAAELSQAIQLDPAITARVLRLANSAYFGFSRKVASVDEAIVVVGFRNVRNLAACAAVAPVFAGAKSAISLTGLWRHSCAVAEANRLIALRLDRDDGPAYVVGLLHDLGQAVLAQILPERYADVRQQCDADVRLCEAERADLGVDHAWAAGELAERWRLTPGITEALRFHHEPERSKDDAAAQVALAECLAEWAGFADPGDPTPPGEPDPVGLSRLGLGSVDVDELGDQFDARREAIDMLYRESLGGSS